MLVVLFLFVLCCLRCFDDDVDACFDFALVALMDVALDILKFVFEVALDVLMLRWSF